MVSVVRFRPWAPFLHYFQWIEENTRCLPHESADGSNGVSIQPSDNDGVVYTKLDDAGVWKIKLVQELKVADFNVDANKVI